MQTADYIHQVRGSKEALVHPDHQDPVAAALFDGEGCEPAAAKGRVHLARFPYADGYGLVRPYKRGGLVRHFLAETYLFDNRPLRELNILRYLYEQEFAVPMPLGACWERTRVGYRGSIATQELDALTLVEYLGNSRETADQALRQCGELIRKMHDLGVFHADLQARNILVGPSSVYLIDFDNARKTQSLGPYQRARNLLRLRRSLEKNRFDPEIFDGIRAGYGEIHIPAWLSLLYRMRGRFSNAVTGAGGKG